MRISRYLFATIFLFAAYRAPMAIAENNPFTQFNVSGTFLNETNNANAALSGWFIVNENNGTVVRVDLFHDSTELPINLSGPQSQPDVFSVRSTNLAGDLLFVALLAPGNDGSLAGYTGGVICTGAIAITMECGGIGSNFDAHDHGYITNDDLAFGSVTDAGPVPLVNISIKPGSASPIPINAGSQGKITVAILSDSSFDAVTNVDRGSLTFGPTGEEQSLAFCNTGGEDVNGDGLPDLVCHFNTRSTRFLRSDTLGILVGKTIQGSPIVGFEAIVVRP